MILTTKLKVNVKVEAKELYENIKDVIKDKALECVKNKQLVNIGIVLDEITVEEIGNGEIEYNTGMSKFWVILKVKLFKPTLKEVVTGKVSSVGTPGWYLNIIDEKVDTNIKVFITGKTTKKEGDEASVEINKISFRNNEYLLFGKSIK